MMDSAWGPGRIFITSCSDSCNVLPTTPSKSKIFYSIYESFQSTYCAYGI